jgi:hypothetical protein
VAISLLILSIGIIMKSKFPVTASHKYVFLVLILSLTSCSILQSNTAIAPISEDQSLGNATLPQMPDFLVFVYPQESITISQYEELLGDRCYPCGITIGIRWDRTKTDLNFGGVYDLLSRISLSVDEKKQPNLAVSMSDGLLPFGPFYFSWTPRLLPGLHEITLHFTTDSGEILIYTWRFVITDE